MRAKDSTGAQTPNDAVLQLRAIAPDLDIVLDEEHEQWRARGLDRRLDQQKGGVKASEGTPDVRAGSRRALLDRLWEIYGGSPSVVIAIAPQSPSHRQRYLRWDGSTFADLPRENPVVRGDFDPGQTLVGRATHEVEADSSRDVPSLAVSAFAGARWGSERGNARYRGSQENLLTLVQDHWHAREPGANRSALDEVVVVPVPVEIFLCDSVLITEATPLSATYSRRAEGEDGYARVSAEGEHEAAAFAGVELYSRTAQCENNGKRTSDADWETVSIVTSPEPRSRPGELPPMNPLTIARNILEKPGGTAMPLSGELAIDFAKAILYHARRASLYHDEDQTPSLNAPGTVTEAPPSPAVDPSPSGGVLPASVTTSLSDVSVSARGNAPDLFLNTSPYLYRGRDEELLGLIQEHWPSPAPSGDTISMSLPPDRFVCVRAAIDETSILGARFHPEHGYEALVQAERPAARSVRAELKRQKNSWSLVEIETSRFEQPEPEHPIALARRLAKCDQATGTDAVELAKSVYHHSQAATVVRHHGRRGP